MEYIENFGIVMNNIRIVQGGVIYFHLFLSMKKKIHSISIGCAVTTLASLGKMGAQLTPLTHLCPPLRSTFAVRETASLGIMGDPRVPPLNPSESIVL